ncbi:MAG: YhcH/YjgK/YiaL family protein [Brevinema sp.]
MIITKSHRLIVDDYPSNIEAAFIFYFAHRSQLLKDPVGTYKNENGLEYRIINEINDDSARWRSYRNAVQLYIILSGEFFLESADIDTMKKKSSEKKTIFYEGQKENRVKLEKDSILVVYPEEAHRFLISFHGQGIRYLQISLTI